MTKSNIIVSISLLSVFVISVAANLKLKALHKAGEIHTGYMTTMLPPFKAVKLTGSGGRIEIYQSDSNAARIFAHDTSVLSYEVKGDTLYISNKKSDKNDGFNYYASYNDLSIAASNVESIISDGRFVSVKNIRTDSMHITTSKDCELELKSSANTYVQLNILDSSTIRIQNMPSLPFASIYIPARGTFQARDVMFGGKQVQLSKDATLQLSGKSLTSFGVLSSQ